MISLAPGVTTIEAPDGLIFVHGRENRVFAYSQPASRYLDRLMTKRGDAAGGAPGSAADLRAIRRQWLDAGLIVEGRAGDASPDVAAPLERGRATPWPGWAAEWTCRFRDLTVRFAEENPRAAPILRNLFQRFEVADASPDMSLGVVHPFEFEAALIEDGAEVLRTNDYGVIAGGVAQRLLMRLHPGTDWMAFLHSSAVRLEDKTVALVGPSGSGKSTLAAWLSARGFDYVSDDLFAVAAPDGRAVPWPMPFSIKQGSWDVLEPVYAALRAQPIHHTKGTQARLLPSPQQIWDASPSLVAAIVFPTYSAGAAPRATPLTAFEALARLLNDRVWIGYPVQHATVQRVLDWLGSIPRIALVYGDLEDAEREVRALL